MLPESCLVLIWNRNLIGAPKAEEVATAVLVSLIFEILYSRINLSDGTKRRRTTELSTRTDTGSFHYVTLFSCIDPGEVELFPSHPLHLVYCIILSYTLWSYLQ